MLELNKDKVPILVTIFLYMVKHRILLFVLEMFAALMFLMVIDWKIVTACVLLYEFIFIIVWAILRANTKHWVFQLVCNSDDPDLINIASGLKKYENN
jgi:hypothetical protein